MPATVKCIKMTSKRFAARLFIMCIISTNARSSPFFHDFVYPNEMFVRYISLLRSMLFGISADHIMLSAKRSGRRVYRIYDDALLLSISKCICITTYY